MLKFKGPLLYCTDESKERSQKPETADVRARGVKNSLQGIYLYNIGSCAIGLTAGVDKVCVFLTSIWGPSKFKFNFHLIAYFYLAASF